MNIIKNIKKNTIFLLIITAVVLYIVLKDDFEDIIDILTKIDIKYILLAFLFYALFIVLKGFVNYKITNDKSKLSLKEAIKHNIITQFFNGVTPFSTGGQPMEVYYLHKEGISITKATNITLQNLINNINELLKPYNNNKDTIEFNKETHEIVYTKNNSLKIFTNTTLKEIIISIFKNQDITFNLIAIGDWNEIYKFEITQKTNKDKPLTYITKETSPNIWNLNKELQQNNNKKLTKNR